MKVYLDIYLNVMAVDYFWRKKLGLPMEGRLNYRPWKYSFINNSRLIYWWVSVFWPVILIASNFYFFLKSIFLPFIKEEGGLSNFLVWLESSQKSESIRMSSGLANLKVVDIRRSEYFFYLTRFERVRIFFASLMFIFWIRGMVDTRDKIQFFDCYRVFCFLSFVRMINDSVSCLHICNHYDRWAMACFEAFSNGVEVWQHGMLNCSLELPVKLKNICRINSLALSEIPLWRGYLLDSQVDFVVRKSDFSLSLFEKKFDVLIISHPAYVADEVKLADYLLGLEIGLSVAYKPHPAHDYSKVLVGLKLSGVDVVSSGKFPDARVAITKGSTLGREYETVGVEVIWWEEEVFNELAEIIKSKLFFSA